MRTTYKTLSIFAASAFMLVGCKDDDESSGVPEVRTLPVTEITLATVQSGGHVTAEGEAPVISRGVVWSPQPAPSLDSHLGMRLEGGGPGIFTSSISDLNADETYYVRAFATNAAGKAYGQEITFTTLPGPLAAYPPGTIHCIEGGAEVVPVFSHATGRIWMDRNLGASRVATAVHDAESYGDLYQWGRFSDGHQCRTSTITSTVSSTDTPGNANFILPPNPPINWLSQQNDNLWQGGNGVNNPCPEGFRLPTFVEWNLEQNAGGLGVMKLPAAGIRSAVDGNLKYLTFVGYYWSSTVVGTNVRDLTFINSGMAIGLYFIGRAKGGSVRCIKD